MWSSSTPRSKPSVHRSSTSPGWRRRQPASGSTPSWSPPSACVRTCSKPAALVFFEAGFGHAGGDGVIFRQSRQPASAQQVETAVTDVREVQHRRNPPGGGERGAHAGEVGATGAALRISRSLHRIACSRRSSGFLAIGVWISSLRRTLTASKLATSPPGWPPIPSATTERLAAAARCSCRALFAPAAASRSAIRNWS